MERRRSYYRGQGEIPFREEQSGEIFPEAELQKDGGADVRETVVKKAARYDTAVVYSVTGAMRSPYFNMVRREGDYFTKTIASTYTARQLYDMNVSIYAYSGAALKSCIDFPAFFNGKCDAVIMKDTGILDIDSEEDFERMQVVAEWLFEHKKDFAEVKREADDMGRCRREMQITCMKIKVKENIILDKNPLLPNM